MEYDLAIHGATIVTSSRRRRASLYAVDGKIAEISSERHAATKEIDATGLYLLPGAIDGHVHFMDPAETDREDFIAGTSAAAVGGVTTVIEHTHGRPVRKWQDLEEKIQYLRDRAVVDHGLAAHVWTDNLEALPELWSHGAAYFKLFTCTTHGVPGLSNAQILGAFRQIAELRSLALLHCEDDSISEEAEKMLRAYGEQGGEVLGLWRSREAELVAVNTASLLAKLSGARAVICHASHPAVVDLAASYRASGADIWIEGCPQYLYLREEESIEEVAFRKFTPPARARSRWESEEMWRRLAFGPITHVSSDHAPSTRSHKDRGIWKAPFGLPGVETTLSMLLEGVASGYLSLERVVELTSEIPARLYGFSPRKGGLRPGSDADLVLVDLEARRVLSDENVVSKAGWSPFSGREVRGAPVMTFVRGQLVAESGRPTAGPGWGQFLAGAGRA